MVTFKQLSKISFSLSKSQQNQIESELTRTPYINHQAIRTFLNDLIFPIQCFDIEAAQMIISLF